MKKLIKKILIEEDLSKDKEHALRIARDVDVWWRSTRRIEYFEKFENPIFDDIDDAAKHYEKNKSKFWLRRLGKDNYYYDDFVDWFNCIEDQIDDFLFQNECDIEIGGVEFYVDPDW